MSTRLELDSHAQAQLGIFFEVVLWASIAAQAALGVIAPLVGLAHQNDPPGAPGFLANRLTLPLTDQGIEAVYGPNATAPLDGTVGIGGVYLTPETTAQLTLGRTSAAEVIATVGCTVLGSAVLISAFVIAIGVVRTIRRGDPFHPRNVKRLYILAITLIGGWAAIYAVGFVASMVVASDPAVAALANWRVEVSLTPLFLGLTVMMLAVVFD
ncbi:MAG: DUF2975 domain-containing protein, partial [Bifidobacteriaceae bacterium]|nr:DUF2975 domain-containing protein [Bifidobacteriaceae bacterium]